MKAYSDDIVDMSEGEPTVQGAQVRLDTEARLRDTFAKFTASLTVQVDEIEVMGDRAFDRGVLRVELQPKGAGEAVIVERRFLEIWRREADGEWRVARAMDNCFSRRQQSLDFRDRNP
jgi:ketosteroid isomerase-like protein